MEKKTDISGVRPVRAGAAAAAGVPGARGAGSAQVAVSATGSAGAASARGARGAQVAAGAASARGAGGGADARGAGDRASAELAAWLAKYEPVERKIIEENERRLANRARRREQRAWAFGALCEATEGLAVVWRREGWSVRAMVRWADGDALTLMALSRWLRKDATRFIDRAESRLRRPLYYARERARRAALARERRRVGRRRTTSPCPTREEILDAWIHRRDSHEAAVRFGSLVHDLECYVDNSLLRDGAGAIVGRRGGVKAWLQVNIPALYTRYTTVMRYKAMAKKLRQVTGLADPVPAAAVLAAPGDAAPRAGKATGGAGEGKRDYGAYELRGGEPPPPEVVRARAVWLEVVDGVRESATALMARLDALTDPNRVEDAALPAAWRAKCENEITARRKSGWRPRTKRKRLRGREEVPSAKPNADPEG